MRKGYDPKKKYLKDDLRKIASKIKVEYMDLPYNNGSCFLMETIRMERNILKILLEIKN